jgi:hypothetical protein
MLIQIEEAQQSERLTALLSAYNDIVRDFLPILSTHTHSFRLCRSRRCRASLWHGTRSSPMPRRPKCLLTERVWCVCVCVCVCLCAANQSAVCLHVPTLCACVCDAVCVCVHLTPPSAGRMMFAKPETALKHAVGACAALHHSSHASACACRA